MDWAIALAAAPHTQRFVYYAAGVLSKYAAVAATELQYQATQHGTSTASRGQLCVDVYGGIAIAAVAIWICAIGACCLCCCTGAAWYMGWRTGSGRRHVLPSHMAGRQGQLRAGPEASIDWINAGEAIRRGGDEAVRTLAETCKCSEASIVAWYIRWSEATRGPPRLHEE